MVERFVQAGNELVAVLSDGEVVASALPIEDWRRILAERPGVTAAAFLP